MGIGSIPDRTSGRRIAVEVHTHAGFLRILAREDVDGLRLSNFSGTLENHLATLIRGLNVDDNVPVAHADVLDLDVELVARQNHADEGDIVTRKE